MTLIQRVSIAIPIATLFFLGMIWLNHYLKEKGEHKK
jgi:hypothetical protein